MPIKVKQEKLEIAAIEVISTNNTQRVLRNRTNTIKTNGDDCNVTDDNEEAKMENAITKNDTADSLREKFPNVNPYEFEFLMFLRGNTAK